MTKQHGQITGAMRHLDNLTAAQVEALLIQLATEECGAPPPTSSSVVHCCARDHAHVHFSPSLSIKSAKSGNSPVTIKCYGRCDRSFFRLSDYLAEVGPVGSAQRFWTWDRVNDVLKALDAGKTPAVGWLQWKKDQGMEALGSVARSGSPVRARGRMVQCNARFSSLYTKYFDITDPVAIAAEPELIMKVCEERGWSAEVMQQCIHDQLVGLAPHGEDNVLLSFAYRGIFESSPDVPACYIKQKLLFRGDNDPTDYATYYDPEYQPDPISDFSPIDVFYQESKRIVFVEGGPDAVSWRHFNSSDAIICLGNDKMYTNLVKHISKFCLRDREVVFALDRDLDNGKFRSYFDRARVVTAEEHFKPLFSAVYREGAASLQLWMCPNSHGPSKDVNDFLAVHGPDVDPMEFALPVFPARERLRLGETIDRLVEQSTFSQTR